MLKQFLEDRRGVSAVEYGLIAASIALTLLAGAGETRGAISRLFVEASNALTGVL
jgi:Flp pilus assembly pilin Flp